MFGKLSVENAIGCMERVLRPRSVRYLGLHRYHRRDRVGYWLAMLDAKPRACRKAIFLVIGRSLGLTCYVSGRFRPSHFAGR